MRKKNLLIILVAAMILSTSLTACGKDKNKNNQSSSDISSNISSETESSKINDTFPSSSKPEMSMPTSSEEETQPTIAEPISVGDITISSEVLALENEEKGWGQGYNVDKDNRPVSCDQYQEKYGEYGGLFIMPVDEKKMYLTFDEGYENGYTSAILDSLKEKECPAVFFVTMPYVKSQPELIQRMIDEGHVVGNHSVRHKSMPSLTAEEQVKELADLHNYMVENFNYQMTLFRPPEGKWSTQSLEIAKQVGYKSVLWSFAYLDYDVNKQMGVEKAFPRVTGAAHNGAVYLLHAVSKDNAEMLGDVIDNLRDSGYELAKLQ